MGKDDRPSEVKAAEKHPDSAKETNPVGEATRDESNVDPYSAGQHIANPEPNNSVGDEPEKLGEVKEPTENAVPAEDAEEVDESAEVEAAQADQDKQADDLQDQKAVDANTKPASK